MTPLYTAEATTTGNGRNGGKGRTSDGRVEVEFTEPTAVGGPDDRRTNPEQLAALGYSACFASALQVVARRRNVTLTDPKVTAKVTLGREGEGYGFDLRLSPSCRGSSGSRRRRWSRRRTRCARTAAPSRTAPRRPRAPLRRPCRRGSGATGASGRASS